MSYELLKDGAVNAPVLKFGKKHIPLNIENRDYRKYLVGVSNGTITNVLPIDKLNSDLKLIGLK